MKELRRGPPTITSLSRVNGPSILPILCNHENFDMSLLDQINEGGNPNKYVHIKNYMLGILHVSLQLGIGEGIASTTSHHMLITLFFFFFFGDMLITLLAYYVGNPKCVTNTLYSIVPFLISTSTLTNQSFFSFSKQES